MNIKDKKCKKTPDDLIIAPLTTFLKKNKNLDAAFFGTNHVGTCGLKVINSLGVKVPSDLALVSFDVFKLFSPPVTAIAQPIEAIADTVITVLLNGLNTSSQHISSQSIILKTDFNIRSSSKSVTSNLQPVAYNHPEWKPGGNHAAL